MLSSSINFHITCAEIKFSRVQSELVIKIAFSLGENFFQTNFISNKMANFVMFSVDSVPPAKFAKLETNAGYLKTESLFYKNPPFLVEMAQKSNR
jgi:hypothetical protein